MRACAACAAWLRRTSLQIRALGDLPSLEAPAELAERLFVPPLAVPETVAGEDSLAVKAVQALDHLSAPAVLDRLVAEELAQPAAYRVERFAGDLDRLRAPRKLETQVLARLRGGLGSRRWIGPVAALAAATVLAWVGAGRLGWLGSSGESVPGHPVSAYGGYSFEVVRPASLDGLHPLARNLAGSLGGGPRRSG